MALKVAVLCGGFSEEQHASRASAKCVAEALEELGHTHVLVEYDREFMDNIAKLSPDAVFPIVQGKYHGDGAVQAALELIGIPYVGSRPQAAAIINHKTLCKKIWMGAGIRTPEFFEYACDEYRAEGFGDFEKRVASNGLTLPVVVKAPTQGGKYGLVFVKDEASFGELEGVFQFDDVLLVERYVEGRFITQGIVELEGKMTALPPVEVIDGTGDEFKRYDGATGSRDPGFTPEILAKINQTTLMAASLLGASGHARLDYQESGGELFLLEINANPGLRPGYSDMIKCSEAAGYDYPALIGMILATAKVR